MNTLMIEALAATEPVNVPGGIVVLAVVAVVGGFFIWLLSLLRKGPGKW